MSSSNYGCYADTVSSDFVKKHCPVTFKAFEEILKEAEVDMDSFFTAQYYDGDYQDMADDFDDELIDNAYGALKDDFNNKTGLYLGTVYHNAEERSDELNGGAWSVEGVYGYTAAGEKFKADIERLEWTTFG